MKHLSCFIGIAFFAAIAIVNARVLSIPRIQQEQSNWCWDATSLMVIRYFGTLNVTQTDIANWAVAGQNITNYTWGATPPNHGIDEILSHWSVEYDYIARDLNSAEQNVHYNSGNPVIIRWGWDNGGGHILLGIGISGSMITINDPWLAGGVIVADTSWAHRGESYGDGSMHTWTHSMWSTMPDPENSLRDSLKLTAPGSGSKYLTGDTLLITWKTSLQGNLKIALMQPTGNVTIVPSVSAALKLTKWKISSTIKIGQYRVIISSIDSTLFSDTSALFSIDAPVTIDTVSPSEDLVKIPGSYWYAACDELGSLASVKPTVSVDSGRIGSFTIATKADSWGEIGFSTDLNFAGASWIKVVYSSTAPIWISLRDSLLSMDGTAFGYSLPASAGFATRILKIDTANFKQPDWITSLQKVNFSLNNVKGLSFTDEQYGKGILAIKSIIVYGKGKLMAQAAIKQAARQPIEQTIRMAAQGLTMQIPSAGVYAIKIYGLDGKKRYEQEAALLPGSHTIPLGSIVGGTYTVCILGKNGRSIKNIVVR